MVLYVLSWPPEALQPCVCWEMEGRDEHSPPEAPCTLLQACLHLGSGWLPHAWGDLWWRVLGELSPTTSSLSLDDTMSRLRHYLPALLPLPSRTWAEALVMWQVGRPHLFTFPGYAHLESGHVWSGGQVWPSGSAAELVALGELGVLVMAVLTFLFALPPCKVSLPSDFLCNTRAS